jgi:sirohydrochlorin cobaltochelatase
MLILIAHGSRDARWRASLETLARAVDTSTPDPEVGLAFMQFTGPTLEEVVVEARGRGIRTFRVLPLFMASAGHVDKDIRPLVEDLSTRHTGVKMDVLTPVGEDPRFHELVKHIAANHRS